MGWQDAPEVGGAPSAASPGKWQESPEVGDHPGPKAAADPDWHRDTIMPLEHNRRTGEWRWAMPGMVQGAIDAASLPGDVLSGKTPLDPRVSMKDQDPATLDRAASLGSMAAGELPLAARNMVPAGAHSIVDASGRALPKLVSRELASANMAPADVRAALEAGGSASVLGDLTPRLQARTGAVATTPGPGQDIVVNALRERAAGANTRIQDALGRNLGPEPVPSQISATIRQGQDALSPEYQQVLANATPGDLSPLAESVENEIMQAKGPAKKAMQQVRAMLDFTPPEHPGLPAVAPQLDPNPSGWLKARQAIDGMLAGETNTDVVRVLKNARRGLDEALAAHVPGIKDVDAKFANLAKQDEAMQLGQRVLDSGRTAPRPAEVAALTAEGGVPTDIAQRLSEGTLAEIYRVVGTTANDRVALKQLLKGEGSWNRDRLVSVFGHEKTDKLIRLLDAEANMATTENLAFGNSKTEVLRSAKEGIEPSKRDAGFVRSAANLKFGDAAVSVADALLGGAGRKVLDGRNRRIAEALMTGGADLRVGRAGSGVGARIAAPSVIEALIGQAKRGGLFGHDSGGGGY